MDFLHCNRCITQNPPGGYYISSCFHIFCKSCVKPDHTRCPMCEQKVKIVRLNGSISQGVKMYFSDPVKTFSESLEKLQQKIEFQTSIRVHLIRHLFKEKEKKRQMEAYGRKKGAEFEAQKKKLAEMSNWIITAERKLQASEEEKGRLQRNCDDLQRRLQSLTSAFSTQPSTLGSPSTPFSFLHSADSHDFHPSPLVDNSPHSTFNMVSPLINSPRGSLDETRHFTHFFDNTAIATAANSAGMLGDDTMFPNLGQSRSMMMSDTNAFSATFNNMFTPIQDVVVEGEEDELEDVTMRRLEDKTSNSLDNWRTPNHKNRTGGSDGILVNTMEMSRRETSLPTVGNNSLNSLTPKSRRRAIQERQQMRDIRRYSSQPGYLAHRKSTQNHSNRNSFLDSMIREHNQ